MASKQMNKQTKEQGKGGNNKTHKNFDKNVFRSKLYQI
jgi:hypothetical protein